HGIRVRNLVGGYEFAWSSVRQVRFDRNSWWATLELLDGDEVSLLAVQVLDGQHAVAAVRTLRRLHAAHAGSGAGRGGSGAGGRAYDVAGSTDADAPDRDG
ncbi:MAG: PH domain-containing protein, partial [Micromonosporaceae bacterium]